MGADETSAALHVNHSSANGRQPGKRPAARGSAFYPRKRANTACQVCRARKTKCDNQKPACSYCVSVGARCIQSPVDLSSFDPASLKILDRLDDLERLLRDGTNDENHEGSMAESNVTTSLEHNDQSTQRAQEPVETPVISNNRSSSSATSVLPERVEHVLQWSSFAGLVKSPQIPRRGSFDISKSRPRKGETTNLVTTTLEPEAVNRHLDNFFLNVHSKNPILDEASARALVQKVFTDIADRSPASCLAMLICALSCIAGPFGPSDGSKLGTRAHEESVHFFEMAQDRIGSLLVSPDIIGAQCFFLSGVYLMYMMQPVCAWRHFSQALATCQHFPFIMRAQQLPSDHAFSPVSTEMASGDTQEQAVYWSTWKSERELRQELSLPDFDLANAGRTLYPPFFPAPPQPPTDSGGPDSPAERARASWLFYLAEISLRRLNSRLCSEILSLRQSYGKSTKFIEVLTEMTTEYETQAREWSQNLPQQLSIRTAAEDDDICLSVLRCHLIDLFELIYWPFVSAALEASSTGSAMSLAADTFAQKGLDVHVQRVHANEPGFFHRHHGAWLMMRSCTRSALVLVAASEAKIVMPTGWQAAVHKVVGMLSYWSTEVATLIDWRTVLERKMELAPT